MKSSTKFVLAIGFGALLILTGLAALTIFRRAEQVYSEVSGIHDAHLRVSDILSKIHTQVLRTGILRRDYLIDPDPSNDALHKKDLFALRASMDESLDQLATALGTSEGPAVGRLRLEVDSYWSQFDVVFEWNPQQKAQLSYEFLRSKTLPQRQAVLKLTEEINDLVAANFAREQETIRRSQVDFRRYLTWMSVIALILSLMVAGATFYHISRLEHSYIRERSRIEQAEQELRLLSQELVRAQEEERRTISRELHDEIGQMLTGIRLELMNLGDLRTDAGAAFAERLLETKIMTENALKTVRDLAMGLRPSMLDDLGLEPALQWQCREFSRQNGIPAIVEIDGEMQGLTDGVRTCVYRVVQESLTNCARHARAKNVRITVHGGTAGLSISIQDDGIGFEPEQASSRGLGLVGMEERVRQLGGTMMIASGPQRGTLLEITIPLVHKRVI